MYTIIGADSGYAMRNKSSVRCALCASRSLSQLSAYISSAHSKVHFLLLLSCLLRTRSSIPSDSHIYIAESSLKKGIDNLESAFALFRVLFTKNNSTPERERIRVLLICPDSPLYIHTKTITVTRRTQSFILICNFSDYNFVY